MVNVPLVVLLAVPTPPPFAGPEINGQMLIRFGLGPSFRLHHLRTNVSAKNEAKGKLSLAKLAALLALWLRLVQTMLHHRPQIVYSYLSQNRIGFLRDTLVILTAWVLGAKVVVHVRGSNFGNFYEHSGPALRWLIRFVVRRLARVILLAERFRTQFRGLVPDDRIRVLPNATDLQEFDKHTPEPPNTDGVFTILFMGHLSPAKGFIDLLTAAPGVLESIPEAVFVFAGEWLVTEKNILFDETGQRLDSDAGVARAVWDHMRHRYGARLKYLGVLDGADKINTFKTADVLVLPSYSEGFPMVVLEAMAASLPVVVTPVGALPEVLQADMHAKFVPPGDAEALSKALIEMARQPEVRQRMGKANRQLVEKRFTPNTINTCLADILRECVG